MSTRRLAAWLLVALAGCNDEPTEAVETAPVAVEVARVSADEAGLLWFAGVVGPARRASVATQVSGTITRIAVAEGDRVQVGQRLVDVDVRTAWAQVRSADAAVAAAALGLEQAERNLARMQRLVEQNLVARVQLEEAEMARDKAAADLASARAGEREATVNVDYGGIDAPFDGVVVQVLAEVGDLAAPGRPLVTVEDQSALELVARVTEAVAGSVSVGDAVKMRLGAGGDLRSGEVAAVLPLGDPQQAGYRVEVRLADPEGVTPGVSGKIGLPGGSGTPSAVVPASAIIRRGSLRGLYVAERLPEATAGQDTAAEPAPGPATAQGGAAPGGGVATPAPGTPGARGGTSTGEQHADQPTAAFGGPATSGSATHTAVLRWVALEADAGENERQVRVLSGVAPGDLVVVSPESAGLRTGAPLVLRRAERP